MYQLDIVLASGIVGLWYWQIFKDGAWSKAGNAGRSIRPSRNRPTA